MKRSFLLSLLISCCFTISAQEINATDTESEKAAVKSIVERFLRAAGNYDLDSMPVLFCEKANIGGASYRNGKWNSFTLTFAEFLEQLRSRTNPSKYTEPVNRFTVHMDGAMLAFVKADAVLIRNGKPVSNNFDYFTLIKENGNWKILNGSYVSIPIDQ